MAKKDETTFRILELFSGIGGMHCALDLADINYEIVAAIDINTTANLVYSSNFSQVPVINRTIETIPLSQWEKWHADIWLMSPPCQPFTRQGKQDDLGDRRTDAFVYLMKTILSQLLYKPKYILLENVSGFEYSQAHELLLQTLTLNHFDYRQFLLSPIQFGIPNSRLRYYLTAVHRNNDEINSSSSNIETRIFHFEKLYTKLRQQFPGNHFVSESSSPNICGRVCNDDLTEQCSHSSEMLIDSADSMFIREFLISDENSEFELNEKQLQRGVQCCDIVSCRARRSLCFTKSYGKYFEGTGSLLCTSSGRLRYFSPKEIANLHCFPFDFHFPEVINRRQAYALLGNSLNVFVVAALLKNLFSV